MGKSVIEIDIPPAEIIVWTGTIKRLNKICSKIGADEIPAGAAAQVSRIDGRFYLLLRTDLIKEIGTNLELQELVHECKHLTNFIMESRGWEISFGNDEPECYLLQEIFRQIYPIWKGIK